MIDLYVQFGMTNADRKRSKLTPPGILRSQFVNLLRKLRALLATTWPYVGLPPSRDDVEKFIADDSPQAFEVKVTECLWAESCRGKKGEDIGYATICHPDFAFAEGYSPKLKMVRDKTLMQGGVARRRRAADAGDARHGTERGSQLLRNGSWCLAQAPGQVEGDGRAEVAKRAVRRILDGDPQRIGDPMQLGERVAHTRSDLFVKGKNHVAGSLTRSKVCSTLSRYQIRALLCRPVSFICA